MTKLQGIDSRYRYELNRNSEEVDFEDMDFGELLKLSADEIKDSHRLVGLYAKNEGFGYRRWSR